MRIKADIRGPRRIRPPGFVANACVPCANCPSCQSVATRRHCHYPQISLRFRIVPARKRGVRVVTNVGRGMRWTRWLRKTNDASADGEVVWSWRPDAGVKLAEAIPPMTVAKEPGHRGEHEAAVKTIAQGRLGQTGEPVVITLVWFFHFHARLRVRAARPAFPAPSVFEGHCILQGSGKSRRGNADPRRQFFRGLSFETRPAAAPQDEVATCGTRLDPHGEEAPTGPREARPDDRLCAVSNHVASGR
jgi:hypothetical protein